MRLPVGKVPLAVLDSLLKRNLVRDDRVIDGPAVGEDAAVIDTGGPNDLSLILKFAKKGDIFSHLR